MESGAAGWFLGGAQLREQVLAMMGGEMGEHRGGEEKQEMDEQKAQCGKLVARPSREDHHTSNYAGNEQSHQHGREQDVNFTPALVAGQAWEQEFPNIRNHIIQGFDLRQCQPLRRLPGTGSISPNIFG